MVPPLPPTDVPPASVVEPRSLASQTDTSSPTPWLLATEAAAYLRVSAKTVYREARAGRLRHARVGGRRELRFRREWLDSFLVATAQPVEVQR